MTQGVPRLTRGVPRKGSDAASRDAGPRRGPAEPPAQVRADTAEVRTVPSAFSAKREMQGVVKDPLHICRWGKEGEPLSEKEAEVSPRGGEICLQCCVKWMEKTPCDDPRA